MAKYPERVLLPLTTEQKNAIASKPQGMSAYIREAIEEKLERDRNVDESPFKDIVLALMDQMAATDKALTELKEAA